MIAPVEGTRMSHSQRGVSAAQLDGNAPPSPARRSTLTSAELRLFPYLSTYLTLPEIGERLYLSRNTIKTQVVSIYRKLGVSSRREAVERARDLGLIDVGKIDV
jgi:DNA-binding NarL/FixJ family response regulator